MELEYFMVKNITKGIEYKLRFTWKKDILQIRARWEQAYFDELSENEWETNWTMRFTKKN